MRRIHDDNINTPKYYEHIWGIESNARPYYDAVRQRALVNKVKEGDKVVDVGAGLYGAVQYLSEHNDWYGFKNVELNAVDFSYTAQEIIKVKCPDINYVLASALEMPFQDDYFDVVISGELVEHMDVPLDLVKEMHRVAKNDGWIVISTVDTNCENAKKHEYPEHVWEFTPQDLIDLFSYAGQAEYTVVGDYHFIYCKVKK